MIPLMLLVVVGGIINALYMALLHGLCVVMVIKDELKDQEEQDQQKR
jgi:predicted metal-binding membrane protein